MRVCLLLGVQLDDETLFDGQINVLSGGNCDNFADHVVCVKLKPLGNHMVCVGLEVHLEALDAATGLLESDDHAGLHLIAGDVDLLAVDGKVAVVDHLTGLAAGRGVAQTEHDVVKTVLKLDQEVVAVPAREDIDLPVEERLIVELYSK